MLKKTPFIYVLIIGALGLVAFLALSGYWVWGKLRPQPSTRDQVIFQGVQYQRLVRQHPRPLVIHVVTVNLRQPGLSVLVTPGNPDADLPLAARTTSHFLEEFDLQLAVNGDGFTPWHSNSLLDYYPRSGDPVAPLGFSASKGIVYAQDLFNHPTLYISRSNTARFNNPPGQIYNAISGNPILVLQGKPAVGGKNQSARQDEDDPADTTQPRTAIGLDKNNRRLIIVVVDGRQPGYSEGVTLNELAEILVEAGAFTAMNLDGGGSTTLARQGSLGQAVVLNSPIDQHIPGRQRVVGNHLGIYAPRLSNP